jgi:hypothetical protein
MHQISFPSVYNFGDLVHYHSYHKGPLQGIITDITLSDDGRSTTAFDATTRRGTSGCTRMTCDSSGMRRQVRSAAFGGGGVLDEPAVGDRGSEVR